ncbi:hypothetical protein P7K49_040145 [Saguinus oedipus]|uniref:Uncharacterized protein n=1 Tax=Saguinus oedipus TaxID=9490 RepID=A0ABQ9T8I3_SAGOE|nr:hypothetical protein P7K49_040145 [Saguinus oedipus]
MAAGACLLVMAESQGNSLEQKSEARRSGGAWPSHEDLLQEQPLPGRVTETSCDVSSLSSAIQEAGPSLARGFQGSGNRSVLV